MKACQSFAFGVALYAMERKGALDRASDKLVIMKNLLMETG